MNRILIFALIIGWVHSDIQAGYRYNLPSSSYDAPVGSIGNLFNNREYYQVNRRLLPVENFVVSTPAPLIDTPIHQYSGSFSGGENVFLNNLPVSTTLSSFPTESPFIESTTAFNLLNNPFGNTVSVTEHPVLIPKLGVAQTNKQQSEVEKHLYFFSAPEEPEEVKTRVNLPAAPAKKNVKVLFIKAPSYVTRPVQIPAQVQNDEKTVVYVLVKKPEEQSVVVEPPPPTPPTKPEVFFIKYKTHKDAQEAIANIQSGSGDSSISADSVENGNSFIGRLGTGDAVSNTQTDFSQIGDVGGSSLNTQSGFSQIGSIGGASLNAQNGFPEFGKIDTRLSFSQLNGQNNFIPQTVTDSPFSISTSPTPLDYTFSTTASPFDYTVSTTASPYDYSISTTASPLDVPISIGGTYQQNRIHRIYGQPLNS